MGVCSILSFFLSLIKQIIESENISGTTMIHHFIWKYWGCFLENTGSSEFLTHLPHYGTVTYLRSTGNQWQELVWLLRILWLLTPNYWINRIYFSPALTVEEDVGLRIPGNLVYWSLSRELSYSQRMYKSQTL